jgi:DNA-binding NarL/FixJ family response regulator
MGGKNLRGQELDRLEAKTLDARFLSEIRAGLNCSAFEAEAVLGVVKEVYFPSLERLGGPAPPGQIRLVVVSSDEPAGKPIVECEKVSVRLMLHRGAEDDRLLHEQGPEGFRRARIADLCQQALSQGGLLTREDLAYRVFFVTPRTISRDLLYLRQQTPETPVPLRSTMKDIGPLLTHRVEIVRLALEGKTMSEICRIMHHSPDAVSNYISTFTRCAQLRERKMQSGQIAFILRRSRYLIDQYIELLDQCRAEKNYAYHLNELLLIGQGEVKKTSRRRR